MTSLPNLKKGVTKDPNPPIVDIVLSPQTVPSGTSLVTTKTSNETIENVDQIIDYISGDATEKIPQSAIEDLDNNFIKQRSFIFNFGATQPLGAGITALNDTPTGFIKNLDLASLFGADFFGTDEDKIIVSLTVLTNTVMVQQDLMLATVRRVIDQNTFEIIMRRLDMDGNTWGANQDIFITVTQIT